MEAIAAAGALPGLASATIQLGTATFQFYQQLHSLYKAIKHGENDLKTAVKRLDQHRDFIKELRFNFERVSGPDVLASTRDLFESYITDSEAEVEEFRNLLSRVGKQHFKQKSLQAVEIGSRLRFHDRSIQKYCDLLDKQMQRFLFLQSSAQSMRIESTLSEVMGTLANQGAKAAAFYDGHSPKEISKELDSQSGTRSNNMRPLREVPSQQVDGIPNNWSIAQLKQYSTLCGTVTVTKLSGSSTSQFAYKIRVEPYSWVSRTLVEWRCMINSMHTAPTLMLSVTTSIMCKDPDVIDALGLVITCTRPSRYRYYPIWNDYLCHPKIPNPSKVRALLDAGRLLKEHVVVGPGSCSWTDVLTACFTCLACYDHTLKTSEDVCCSLWDPAELLRHYRGFSDVIELLLSRGFEPTLSSWQSIYYQAMQYFWRVSRTRPGFVFTMNQKYKSISTLILNACGYSIPINVLATYQEQFYLCLERLRDAGATPYSGYYISGTSVDRSSHLGHLIAIQCPADMIRRETPDLNVLDLADEQHMLDRWLLGLFAPHRPEIALLLQQYLESYKATAAHEHFEVEYIREEFKHSICGSFPGLRADLLNFICLHGNATILQQLDINALSQSEIYSALTTASQNSSQEIFDILASHIQSMPDFLLLHTKMMRERLTTDPDFPRNFVASLRTHGDLELLSGLFHDSYSGCLLFATDSYPLPAYMRNFIVSLVQSYEAHPTTGYAVHSLIFRAMTHHWSYSKSAEHLLENVHLYYLLDKVVRSPAFKSLLDSSPKGIDHMEFSIDHMEFSQDVFMYPSVVGYSPLMLALHCGMRPAVQILVDAGASISTLSNCGKSPLSVAYEYNQAQHPRQWMAKYDQSSFDGTEGQWRRPTRDPESMWVSESTDKEMLKILLKALRDRGEVVEEGLDELPVRSKWEIFREKTRCFAQWLFKPSYTFDADTFRENSIYAILVSTLWFLSVLKILKAELGDYPTHVVSLLSRPAVLLALVVLIVSILR
ncbi:hypothetical protein F4680DRAFT_427677 [Xylaria scruposa]|nr:hypothetical protein F4680DRAFT_427677 [Xylaria scruposa]